MPRDTRLNEFVKSLAQKDAEDERMREFKEAGGKHMGSKYQYFEPEY
jgi:hypothetical protein